MFVKPKQQKHAHSAAISLGVPSLCDAAGLSPMLAVSGLEFSYGPKTIIDNLSFAVPAGSITCMLGASGSGKSTTLRLIAGLQGLQAGQIDVDSQRVSCVNCRIDVAPQSRQVGMMFQDFALFPHMRAWQNVAYGLKDLPKSERKAAALKLLDEVEMLEQAEQYPHQLSGGQQQRVALARAIAPSPKVLLLDEPFSGLDASLRSRLRDMTLHLVKERNIATVIVTHDPEEALFMADWIVLLDQGKIEQQGLPQQLYFEPASPKVVRFFGEVNALKGWVNNGRIETELGPLRETKLPDGTELDVLIRPEAMKVCPVPMLQGAKVEVEAARSLGRQSELHLGLVGNQDVHLHARISGQFLPKSGSQFGIGLDPDMAYVFDREPSSRDTKQP